MRLFLRLEIEVPEYDKQVVYLGAYGAGSSDERSAVVSIARVLMVNGYLVAINGECRYATTLMSTATMLGETNKPHLAINVAAASDAYRLCNMMSKDNLILFSSTDSPENITATFFDGRNPMITRFMHVPCAAVFFGNDPETLAEIPLFAAVKKFSVERTGFIAQSDIEQMPGRSFTLIGSDIVKQLQGI